VTLNVVKLVKVLGMTGSIHDGEAVAAIRRANDMLSKEKLTWESFFSELTAGNFTIPDGRRPKEKPLEPTIKEMFEVCLPKVKGPPREFLQSIYRFWGENDYLTRKQESALRKFYDNIKR